jgi:hypothetical protein
MFGPSCREPSQHTFQDLEEYELPRFVGLPTKNRFRRRRNPGVAQSAKSGRSPQNPFPPASFSGSRTQFALSVYRRAPVFHHAFFEHFEFPRAKKIWWFPVALIPRRFLMKNVIRLVLATVLLLGAMSTSSLADGGAPMPLCSPGHCGGK